MRHSIIFLLFGVSIFPSKSQSSLTYGFDHPQDTVRTKAWCFFGETETTRECITADLEAFKTAGVGGVVYYDQVHGKGEGANKVFVIKIIGRWYFFRKCLKNRYNLCN